MADQKLLDLAATQLAAGVPDESIRASLTGKGWSLEDINGAIAIVKLRRSPLSLSTTQHESFVLARKSNLVSSIFQVVLILILLASAPGAYGLITRIAIPSIKGEPVAVKDTLKEYELLRDVPSLIPVASIRTKPPSTKSNTTVATGGSHSVPPSSGGTTATPPTTGSSDTNSPASVPVVTFTASDSSLVVNTRVTLSWNAPNAKSCTATGFDTGYKTTGSVRMLMTSSGTFGITCTNEAGSTHKDISIQVQAVTDPVPEPTPVPVPVPVPVTPTSEPVTEPGSPPEVEPTPSDPDPVIITDPIPEPNQDQIASTLTGSYPVYSGCEAPAQNYLRTIYIDATNGSDTGDGSAERPYKSLQTILNGKIIHGGDHIVLLPGTYGVLGTTVSRNPQLQTSPSAWVWLDFRPGAIGSYLELSGMSRWIVTNPELTYPAGSKKGVQDLISVTAGSSNVIIADGNLYTAKSSSGWSADKWINGTDSGIFFDNSKCVSAVRNKLTNIRRGIGVNNRTMSPDASQNSMKALIQDNTIKNHSGDGLRPIGSDITLRNNFIIDNYVSAEDGDGNHDDGIQGFALNGAVYENLVIDHNWIQETTDINRPLNASMQGISAFDGIYKDVRITNNVVIISAYHGMKWSGTENLVIDHNTIINFTNNGHKTWIAVTAEGKLGQQTKNARVANNTAVRFVLDPSVSASNNISVTDPAATYTTFDPANGHYNLAPKAGSILDGKGAGAYLKTSSEVAIADTAIHVQGIPERRSLLASALTAYNSFLAWIERLFSRAR